MNFYQLEPYGLNTKEVESFTSYMIRLSVAHGMTLPTLLNYMRRFDRQKPQSYLEFSATDAKPWNCNRYMTPTAAVSDLVDLVQIAVCRQDLRCTTLLSMQNLAVRTMDFFHHDLNWCPTCWRDDIEANQEPYHRLIWSFKEVRACHVHGTLLRSRCSNCYEIIWPSTITTRIENCVLCGHPLFLMGTKKVVFNEKWCPTYLDLIDLVQECASDSSLLYREDKIRSLLLSIVAQSVEFELEDEFWKKFCSLRGDWKQVIRGKRITLLHMRRFAHRLGISLPGLLDGNPESWTSQLDPEWSWDLPSPLVVRKRNRERDYASAEKHVRNYIERLPQQFPLPLKQVAQELELSVGGLEYNFPELGSQIKMNYRTMIEKERAKKIAKAEKVVRAYMLDPYSHKSKKVAVARLMSEYGLPKNLLREALKEY